MPFMYIHLRRTEKGTRATVAAHGHLPAQSTGSENSRLSKGPFAVFQVDEFDGIENIDTDSLITELQKRMAVKDIIRILEYEFTDNDILAMLKERLR